MKIKKEKKALTQGKAMHPFIPLLVMVVLCTIISYFVVPGAYDRETVDGVNPTTEDVFLLLDTYVHYFNNRRPAAALGYKSPVQYKTELGF